MPKPQQPAETFGAFAIYRDGTVTTIDGRRPAELLVEHLRSTDQTIEEDIAVINAFARDFANAKWRASVYADAVNWLPLPLEKVVPVEFVPAKRGRSAA
jgi:hypothetical protein